MSNRFYAVCGILDIDGKILFVRHTYGPAKERILIPGGYVKEGELPSDAVKPADARFKKNKDNS